MCYPDSKCNLWSWLILQQSDKIMRKERYHINVSSFDPVLGLGQFQMSSMSCWQATIQLKNQTMWDVPVKSRMVNKISIVCAKLSLWRGMEPVIQEMHQNKQKLFSKVCFQFWPEPMHWNKLWREKSFLELNCKSMPTMPCWNHIQLHFNEMRERRTLRKCQRVSWRQTCMESWVYALLTMPRRQDMEPFNCNLCQLHYKLNFNCTPFLV